MQQLKSQQIWLSCIGSPCQYLFHTITHMMHQHLHNIMELMCELCNEICFENQYNEIMDTVQYLYQLSVTSQ
jgi:hypothetical protein